MKIYVGNLPYSIRDNDLEDLFAPYGEVVSASVIMEHETRRSKGFGFVEMANKEEAQKAIDALDSKEIGGRALKVNEARPRKPKY
ncbi:MAG: RNA-binding protein [Candidatus Riflebacteria bacterium]|nr:RNA-binding protein [Candidatus Riflebacteria bacterium]